MGISGLLPNLKSVTERVPITSLRGKTVAVDAYVLLHKGAYACSRELVEGIPTDKCTKYCVRRIEILIEAGVVPYVVFDGGPLPNKKDEEDARHASRAAALQKARHLWHQGSKVASMEYYQRAVDITPEIANAFVQELKRRKISFLVAPYEADAQCAYLAMNGFVDAVMTEDSDLLCYGCPNVLFKFDGSVADKVQFGDLAHCRELSFVGWDLSMFQQMCVLAGCDFVKALPGIGVKKAHAHMRRTRSVERVIRGLRYDGIKVPKEYAGKVQRALWTFKYQRVYCPRRHCVVNLNEIPELGLESDGFCPEAAVLVGGEADFLGKEIDSATARGIAEGRLNPVTWLPFVATARTGGNGRQQEQRLLQCQQHAPSLFRRAAMAGHQWRMKESGERTSEISHQLYEQDLSGSESSRRAAVHVRKPNGQLVVNLQAVKKGLKRALGLNQEESEAIADIENNDANNESAMQGPMMGSFHGSMRPLSMPDVTVAGVSNTATINATTISNSSKNRKKNDHTYGKTRRQCLTPSRNNNLLYDDGFDSPTITGNDGSLFSSKKYREQMNNNGDSSLHYASVERDAAQSTDRIEAFWERGRASADARRPEPPRSNPFSLFQHD